MAKIVLLDGNKNKNELKEFCKSVIREPSVFYLDGFCLGANSIIVLDGNNDDEFSLESLFWPNPPVPDSLKDRVAEYVRGYEEGYMLGESYYRIGNSKLSVFGVN